MTLLSVRELTVSFRRNGRRIPAVDGVDLDIAAGETVGLVGGSGAGKSTLARAVAGLIAPDHGRIVLDGTDLCTAPAGTARHLRRALHLVFQDPYAALPPSLTVARIVAEPLAIQRLLPDRDERDARVAEALTAVRLTPLGRYLPRYPHQLSGGERQRVALARAVVTRPRLILADEPTQMLDASLRAGIVDLLDTLRAERGLALLHVTHDLALAGRSCSRLVVLHAGRVVEHGPTQALFTRPAHAYTAALITAARRLHTRRGP
jgi:peptide/nickel transport system ATP-binding protein